MKVRDSSKKSALLVTLSPKQELFCWLIGGIAAIELFDYSNAFKLTPAACYYGLALLSVVVLLFCLKFRNKRSTPEPMWLKILANSVLVIVTAIFLLYVVGIAAWYYE